MSSLYALVGAIKSVIWIKYKSQVANVVGKLDIVWRTAFGERGRLQTSQLQRVVCMITAV